MAIDVDAATEDGYQEETMSEVPVDDLAMGMLRRRIEHERDHSRRDLESEIRNLTQRLRIAAKALAAGDRIDPHLIANVAMMTETVARWNTAIDLMPLVAAAESGRPNRP